MKQVKHINHILKRFVDGLYTHDDADRLLNSFQDNQYPVGIGEVMDDIWISSEERQPTFAQQEQYKEEARQLLNRIQKQEKRFSFLPVLKYAAILVVILSAGWSIYQFTRASTLEDLVYTEILVKNGEHKHITLPDGTKVILNAGSSMKYPERFIGGSRLVEMDGEAFFEVTRDESNPFIVRTKDADVRVLGTSFNIKAYGEDEQLLVSVQSGKVQVDMPEAMMRLHPNEQLVLDKHNGEFRKKNENANRVTVWMRGGLYFNRTPVRSVIQELERMYNREITFTPGETYNEYIYGEHDNKSLESVLKSIQYTTGIKFRQEGSKIVLYKKE